MLRNVLLGRCKLTPEAARRLCELFGLSLAERRYVCALVERDQTVDAARREMLDRRLLRLRLGRIARVKPSRYRLYDRWYHTALWAMLAYRPFDGNCDALGAALTPPVTGQQVRESIEMLVHLGMLRADRDGRLHPATPLITTGHAAPDCLRTYHLATIDLAKDAVDRFPRGVREVSTVTVALSGPAFTRVKGYLAECRRKVLARSIHELPHVNNCHRRRRISQKKGNLVDSAIPPMKVTYS